MMEFKDIGSGTTMYVDPAAIQAVVPAFAPPEPGIAAGQWIPKQVGSQLFIAGCAPLAVRGDAAGVAAAVAKAKAGGGRLFQTN